MTHVHLIGIGGSGLSAIALVLLESGMQVSGSDRMDSTQAQRLRDAGAQVFTGHRPENVRGADVVVRSSAIPVENVEVQAALEAGLPVLKRADFLGRLMEGRQGIAVAGTHGKTTTTAMIAWMLAALGLDPSYIIGSVAANLGANAHAGQGPHFVIEADEYDYMFLGLRPQLAIVTNVEYDHPDCFPTPQMYRSAFIDFAMRLERGGALLACADDPGAAQLLEDVSRLGRSVLAYGIEGSAAVEVPQPYYTARSLQANDRGGFSFDFAAPGGAAVRAALAVPGVHNVRNALAALAAAHRLELPLERAAAALGKFRGTDRRFEVRGEAGGVTVIDDYAHHPTAVRATLAAARARYPGRRIWAVWQPHTYSRTRSLLNEFAAAFEDADQVVVTEIYAAREQAPEDGFSGRKLAETLAERAEATSGRPEVHFAPTLAHAREWLLARLAPGDVLLVLSAGDADQISAQVLESLQR